MNYSQRVIKYIKIFSKSIFQHQVKHSWNQSFDPTSKSIVNCDETNFVFIWQIYHINFKDKMHFSSFNFQSKLILVNFYLQKVYDSDNYLFNNGWISALALLS